MVFHPSSLSHPPSTNPPSLPPFFYFYAPFFFFFGLCFVSYFWSPSLISVAVTPLLHLVDSPPHPVVTFSFILVTMGFLDLVLSKLDLFLSGLPDQRRPSPPPSPASLPPACHPPRCNTATTRQCVATRVMCLHTPMWELHSLVRAPHMRLLFHLHRCCCSNCV
jgi:hypothetical protein